MLFTLLDKIEYEFPQLRDDILSSIMDIYDADQIDTINCYINYNWAEIDGIDGEELIMDYINSSMK